MASRERLRRERPPPAPLGLWQFFATSGLQGSPAGKPPAPGPRGGTHRPRFSDDGAGAFIPVWRPLPLDFSFRFRVHSNRNSPRPRVLFCTIVYTNSTKVKPHRGRSRKTPPYNNGTDEGVTLQRGKSRVLNFERELNSLQGREKRKRLCWIVYSTS